MGLKLRWRLQFQRVQLNTERTILLSGVDRHICLMARNRHGMRIGCMLTSGPGLTLGILLTLTLCDMGITQSTSTLLVCRV